MANNPNRARGGPVPRTRIISAAGWRNILMIFGPQKREYVAAIEALLAQMETVAAPIRDAIATLERMKRLRFKSRIKEAQMAARMREVAAMLAPFVEKYSVQPIAENFRESEATAVA